MSSCSDSNDEYNDVTPETENTEDLGIHSGLTTDDSGSYVVASGTTTVNVVLELPVAAAEVSTIEATLSVDGEDQTVVITRAGGSWSIGEPVIDEENDRVEIPITKDADDETPVQLAVKLTSKSGDEYNNSFDISVASLSDGSGSDDSGSDGDGEDGDGDGEDGEIESQFGSSSSTTTTTPEDVELEADENGIDNWADADTTDEQVNL